MGFLWHVTWKSSPCGFCNGFELVAQIHWVERKLESFLIIKNKLDFNSWKNQKFLSRSFTVVSVSLQKNCSPPDLQLDSVLLSGRSASLPPSGVEQSAGVNVLQDWCVGYGFSDGALAEHCALCSRTLFHFTQDFGRGVSAFWRASVLVCECLEAKLEGVLIWSEMVCCLMSSQCLSSSLKIFICETKDASESNCRCGEFSSSMLVAVIFRDVGGVSFSVVWTAGLDAEASLLKLEIPSRTSNSVHEQFDVFDSSGKEKETLLCFLCLSVPWAAGVCLTLLLLTGLAVIGLLSELLLSSWRRHNRRLVFLAGARITGVLWVDDESLQSSWYSEK